MEGPGDPVVEDAFESSRIIMQSRNSDSKVAFEPDRLMFTRIMEHQSESESNKKKVKSMGLSKDLEDNSQFEKHLKLNLHPYLPLVPTHVYGRNEQVPILNLTGPSLKHHIAYSASNNIILLDYVKGQQTILQGHRNQIVTLVKDRNCKHFASADMGTKSTLIIWDILIGSPYRAVPLWNVHSSNGVVCIDFAGYSAYVGALGAEKHRKQIVSIWPFVSPQPIVHPICQYRIPGKVGFQHEIVFHPEKYNLFATTGNRGIAFYAWSQPQKHILCHVPQLPKLFLDRMKKFTRSVWSRDDCFLLTSTMGGFIIIWDAPSPVGLAVEPLDPHILEFKRCYKIGTNGLTSFMEHDGSYIIGDDAGVVSFYNKHFRLLRWTKNHKASPVYSIAVNHPRHQPTDFQRAIRDGFAIGKSPQIDRDKLNLIRDFTMRMTYFDPPSDAVFQYPDFFLGAAEGNVYYYHVAEDRIDVVVHGANSSFVACDVNQVSKHLALITVKGEIHLYEMRTHRMVYRRSLFKKPIKASCLKFHPTGAFALVGTLCGKIFARRVYRWKSIDFPVKNARSPICTIIFSDDGLFMAFQDKSRAVGLYANAPEKSSCVWSFKGKRRMHFKEIVDIIFYWDRLQNKNRLISLGADRRIIEYDIMNSSPNNGLQVLTVAYLSQFSVPRCMMVITGTFQQSNPHIVIAHNNYKLSVYDLDDRAIVRTCQAPMHEAPPSKMITVKLKGGKKGEGRDANIFVCGNKLGLAKCPFDGTPYKYSAVLSHPTDVKDLTTSFDYKSVYSIGNNEAVCIQWRTNISAIEKNESSGDS